MDVSYGISAIHVLRKHVASEATATRRFTNFVLIIIILLLLLFFLGPTGTSFPGA